MYSPLEQFLILPVFVFNSFIFSNEFIFLILMIFFIIIFILCLHDENNNSLYIIPTNWQLFFQSIYDLILFTVVKNINHIVRGQKFFPLIFCIFVYILSLNLIGLIPNSFTLTSHLIVTFGMSISFFIGITIVCVLEHGVKFFSLFLPSGTPTGLAFLLIPIEVISYVFKPLSLSIRLFANLMAGHTLMHVIAGFGYTFIIQRSFIFFLHYIPVIIILPLFLLDLAVCTIQAFVFSILLCIYINDALLLH